MKKYRLIFAFRFLAVLDVLFSKRFELETFEKDKRGNWTRKAMTKFCSQEIKEKLK